MIPESPGIVGVVLYSAGAFTMIVVAVSAWMEWKRERESQPIDVEREGADA